MPDHASLVHIARREARASFTGFLVLSWIVALGAFLLLALLAYLDIKLAWIVSAGFALCIAAFGLLIAEAVQVLAVRLSYIEQASTETLNYAERLDEKRD